MSLLRQSWRLIQASAESGAASRCCRSFRYCYDVFLSLSIACDSQCSCCDQPTRTYSNLVSLAVMLPRLQEDKEQHLHHLALLPAVVQMPEQQAALVRVVPQAHTSEGQAGCSKMSSPWLQRKSQLHQLRLPASLEQQCERCQQWEMPHF